MLYNIISKHGPRLKHGLFIWGFDYKLTNCNFKRNVNSLKNQFQRIQEIQKENEFHPSDEIRPTFDCAKRSRSRARFAAAGLQPLQGSPEAKGAHGFIFRRGFSSIRLTFLELPRLSSIFLDFHALVRYFLTFWKKSPAKKGT